MTTWETPTFEEINMSAEIGGYQNDFDKDGDAPPEPKQMDEASDDR